MQKNFWIFFLILLASNKLCSQTATEKIFQKKFSDSSSTNNNSCFYLVRFTTSTPELIKKRIRLFAVRQLSTNQYIIKADFPILSTAAKQSVFVHTINNKWKASTVVEKFAEENNSALHRYTIQISDVSFTDDIVKKYFPQATVFLERKIISVVTSYDSIKKYFLNDDRVIYVDAISSPPATELGVPGFDLSANNISAVHNNYPLIKGEEMHVSLKEDYYDTTDIDIKGRLESSPLASQNVTNHANYMATIIAGAGNSVYYANGVAPEAHISSSSFKEVLPDEDAYYIQNNITVQNHSYGTVIDNNYGLNAVAFDRNTNTDTALLHVFSSGNTGDSTSDAGSYAGIAGFANLTGNFKMAKNVITVGAVDTFGNPALLSSKGPAYDGRIKPDITAFQINGTSELAALVSGTAVLMQQLFKSKNNNSLLPSALAKAILINSADDVSNPGPDYTTGFGNLNAAKAMKTIGAKEYFSGVVSNGEKQVFNLSVPAHTASLKVSLAWNDTAALPGAPTALVNDLDLSVVAKSTGQTWQPWVLSSVANKDSLSKNAVRKRDSLNNEEQVTITNPPAGEYELVVSGFNVVSALQKFYVAFSLDSLQSFNWKNLSKSDFVLSDEEAPASWETNISGTGVVELAFPPFSNWSRIEQNADLSKGYLYWDVPDTTTKAMLRMKTGNKIFYSDTFLISILAKPTTGYLCGDSLFIYWNKLKGIDQYQVFQLGEKFMEPLVKTNDTTASLSAGKLKSNYLSVAPILPDGTIGTRSYGFNYTDQNAGCFISSFYATATDSIAALSLTLGTLYSVDSIFIQKNTASGFHDIGTIAFNNNLSYQYSYGLLSQGVTFFRTRIVLRGGKIIYSDQIPVYYSKPGNYLIFPVPLRRGQNIEIYTPIPDEEVLTLTDASGRIVLTKPMQLVHEYLPTNNLPAGVYFYKITKKDKRVDLGKIVVL